MSGNMATWDQQIKFEESPAESFISTPGDSYPSLFESQSQTLDPSDMMTPPNGPDDEGLAFDLEEDDDDTPATDGKKPTKKRKSWGQVLPEPKTNLPPRKRAKTEDEKEQRRVERVLRNRRAAQSSRERKRLEVEALEKKNKELEAALNHARQTNLLLAEELKKFRRDSGARSSSPFDSFHSSNPVTLSQELFGSHDGLRANSESKPSLVDELINSTQQSNVTVNPASLSPVPETNENEIREASVATPAPVDISSDMTQRPAVSIGEDAAVLAGHPDSSVSGMDDCSAPADADDHFNSSHFGLSEAFDADRYVLESGLLSSPNSVDYENDYMAGDSSFLSVDPFDITEFLHDELNNAAATDALAQNDAADPLFGHRLPNSETQVSSENPNLQPQSGASTHGCDDGGIAVGV